MASSPSKTMKEKQSREEDTPLTEEQIRAYIRFLDATLKVSPKIIFSKRATRNFCYTRPPVMQLPQNASIAAIDEEYAHALHEKRSRANQKTHPKEFKQALADVRYAAPTSGASDLSLTGDDDEEGPDASQLLQALRASLAMGPREKS